MAPQATDGQWGTRRTHARFLPTTSTRVSSSSLLPPSADLSAVRKPKLLDQVRYAIRTRHYSLRTEDAYIYWIKRSFSFTGNATHERWEKKKLANSCPR
jgi:integrase-like protein